MKLLLAFAVCLELFTPWVVSNYVAVPCSDKEALAVAEKAIEHINRDRKHGFKYAVDRLENAQKETNGNTTYYLDIDVRETKCHVLIRKPLKDCKIRPFLETKGDGDCKVLIETTPEGTSHVNGYKCDVSPDSAEDVLERCPDCPVLIPVTSEQATHAAQVSLNKFNEVSNHTHHFDLQEIVRASVTGIVSMVTVEFLMKETTCLKNSDICTLQILPNPDLGFCRATVTPSSDSTEGIILECEIYNPQVARAEGDGAAPPAAEGDGAAPPEAEGTGHPDAKDQTVIHQEVVHDEATVAPDVEESMTVAPKRKRSAGKESSESSEEHVSGSGMKVVFPDLPADLTTCPGIHKYHEHQ
ncbi:alpha-2-HS-glycoprotein [Pristis pectinata]|uniref:alpha-2-HS-glycoprotein n=1 Tax=Pristis pectinata TaxID=685728 RepID=UPI00223DADEC|nr:alpha-2-HS-glycoprotein [Pristis pectinata]